MGIAFEVVVLLLDTNLSIIIELASEQKMIGILEFQIVTASQGMNLSV